MQRVAKKSVGLEGVWYLDLEERDVALDRPLGVVRDLSHDSCTRYTRICERDDHMTRIYGIPRMPLVGTMLSVKVNIELRPFGSAYMRLTIQYSIQN